MYYFVKNSTLVQNLSVVGFGSDTVQNISAIFKSRISWFWSYKQHDSGRSVTSSSTQAYKRTVRKAVNQGKLIQKKHKSDGLKTHQAMDAHLKHPKGNEIIQMKAYKEMHTQMSPLKTNQARDMLLKRTEEINSGKQATVIVFDIETNGRSKTSKIIEFAAQDLAGGEFSTFQSLVNPEGAFVGNSYIHQICTEMVNKPDVPRWRDLVPILIQYVRIRQKAGGPVLWVAHNNRTFDARFIAQECHHCSLQLPSDWLFVDTLPLAREAMKLNGNGKCSVTLCALREYYKIPSMGPAHRAMADCNVLALVLQKLSFDLKLTVSDLIEKAFKISDIAL